MRNKCAAFLMCAQSLLSSAFAGTHLPPNGDSPQAEQEKGKIVQFTGADPDHNDISEGLKFAQPEQINALVVWLKENRGAICTFTGHASWANTPFMMQLTAARIETVMSALRQQGIDTTEFVKIPRGGLDYQDIGKGESAVNKSMLNKSVMVDCEPLVSWAPRYHLALT